MEYYNKKDLIMLKIFDNQIEKISLYFSIAELKAFLNAFLMPLCLIVISNNILTGLCWVFLLTIVYKTIQKHKVENARIFFKFLLVESIIFIGITLLVLMLNL